MPAIIYLGTIQGNIDVSHGGPDGFITDRIPFHDKQNNVSY